MYIPKVFKCVMPVGLTEITSNLDNNMKYAISQIASKTFLSVYTTNDDGEFREGYSANILSCDLPQIYKDSKQEGASLTTVFKNCGNRNAIHEIAGLINEDGQNHVILNQAATVSQNDTATVLDELYEVMDTRLSSNGTISYLGLEDCSPETANNALQQFKDYLISLIPTTTTTTESPIDKGWDIKNHLNITSNDAYEAGKKFLHMLGISVPDTTTPPPTTETSNDDTNDGGYTAAHIAAAVLTTVGVVGLAYLGYYGIKRGIDWYKGEKSSDNKIPLEKVLNIKLEEDLNFIKKILERLNMQELSENKYYLQLDEETPIEDINYPQLILKITQFYKQLSVLCNSFNEANTTPYIKVVQKVKEIEGVIKSLKALEESNVNIDDNSQQHLYIGHVTDLNKIFAFSNIYTPSNSGMHSSNTSNELEETMTFLGETSETI